MASRVKVEAKTAPDFRGAGYECKLICDQLSDWEWQLEELQAWHFDKLDVLLATEDSSNFRLRILYGGAPSNLLGDIASLFLQGAKHVYLEKSWPKSDNEIWIELPPYQSIKIKPDMNGLNVKLPRTLH